MIGLPLKTFDLLRFSRALAFAAIAALVFSGCGHFSGGRDYDGDDDAPYSGGLDSLFGGLMLPPPQGSGNGAPADNENPRPDEPAILPGGESPAAADGYAATDSSAAYDFGAGETSDEGFDPLPPVDYIPEGVIPKLGEDGEPLLRTGLTIAVHVTVADKTEVPTQVRLISPENTVMLPFVGVVSCEGMTIRKFREHLTKLYGDYLHDPVVSAEFVTTGDAESPWGKVRVMGHVGREGWINIPATRDLSLLRALQRAGGVSKGAKRTKVRITRNMPDGTKKVFSADLDKLGEDGDEAQDIPLQPGDTVWVAERVW